MSRAELVAPSLYTRRSPADSGAREKRTAALVFVNAQMSSCVSGDLTVVPSGIDHRTEGDSCRELLRVNSRVECARERCEKESWLRRTYARVYRTSTGQFNTTTLRECK